MLSFFFACTVDYADNGGVLPILAGEGFYDTPIPSDSRLVNGRPSLEGFPGADEVPLIADYVAVAPQLDGWGTNSPIYLRFEDVPDLDEIPSAAESIEPTSNLQLIDIDAASDHRGEAVPVVTQFWETADQYGAANLLAVMPVAGFPLRPHTKYALIVRSPIAGEGAMPENWEEDPYWLPLLETLPVRALESWQVNAATIFTTASPVQETSRIATAIQSGEVGRPPWEPQLTLYEEVNAYLTFEGFVTVPIWQRGERPYRSEGGGFVFDEFGNPEVQGWERIRFALVVPNDKPPDDGWPLVVYSHGTGGDYLSFVRNRNDDEGPGMAERGVAMIGISQPLHGDRKTDDTNEEFDTFNYLNPESGRSSFRQGALDQVWMVERMSESATSFVYDGDQIEINHDRLMFFGHSQGAMVGALAAPFISTRVVAVGLSAAGGGTAEAAISKVDPIPVLPLLASALRLDEEVLSVLHPVLGMVQMLSDATDPMNYGPYWFSWAPEWEGESVDMLLTEGLEDTYTPPRTIEALATAAGMPIAGEMLYEPAGFALRGLGAEALPFEENIVGFDGGEVTAGLAQFADVGHFAIYEDDDAKDLYRDFLESAAYDDDPRLK